MENTSWESICKATAIFTVIFLLALVSFFTFSTKEFNGYYLSKHEKTYAIMINWENASDERAFESTNPDETLRVFKTLTDNASKR